MSDNIPFEMQAEIMKRLPVRSLIQFRSVSKAWKSLIDSPRFIAGYSSQQSESQHILVRYDDPPGYLLTYISIADDVSFPQHNVSLTPPPFVNLFLTHEELGISRGLFCLYSRAHDGYGKVGLAVLWNVAIRKSVAVVVPNMINNYEYGNVLGFGVCSRTNDPKIVKITFIKSREGTEGISSIPWQVEVFTLSTRAWRRPYSSNLPRKSISFIDSSQVVVDGVVYWLATDRITMVGGSRSYNLIVSFDLTSEEFGELNVPDCLACQDIDDNTNLLKLSMCKLRESLVVLERIEEANNTVYVVWMMGDGFPKSFTKLLTINLGTLEYASVLGFRKSGEPLINIPKDDREIFKLAVYEPYTKQIDRLGIDRAEPLSVHSSMETLLLHDQPNHTLYNSWNDLPFYDSRLHELNIQLVNV